MELSNVAQASEKLFALLKELGYSDGALVTYRRIGKNFQAFCLMSQCQDASFDGCADMFIEEYLSKHEVSSSNGKKRLHEVLRYFNMLRDLEVYGVILNHRLRRRTIAKEYNDVINSFCDYLISKGLAKGTSERNRFVLEQLSDFLAQRKCQSFSEMTMQDLLAFSTVQMSYSKKSAAASMYALRVFIDFLAQSGINNTLSKEDLPKVHFVNRRYLPKIWSEDECCRVLKSVNRDTPAGKRDFAILLLVINNGMRTSDVLSLLLSDIDWHSKEIHFTQKKTGNACTVAFDEATGWAIIDYLKNGRPNIKQYSNVFLQARPPFIPMNSFNVCLQKYVERAGIHYKNNQLHGMHSLRHSLATRMLNNGTSAETISEVLGHININSTVDYLQVNMDQLRRCALETEVTE